MNEPELSPLRRGVVRYMPRTDGPSPTHLSGNFGMLRVTLKRSGTAWLIAYTCIYCSWIFDYSITDAFGSLST